MSAICPAFEPHFSLDVTWLPHDEGGYDGKGARRFIILPTRGFVAPKPRAMR
jgi:hypothetical protein